MHRVTSAPGAQASVTRYVVGYFARPAGDVAMKRLVGREYPDSLIPPIEDEDEKLGNDMNDMNARDWEWHKLSEVKKGNIRGSLGGRPFEPKRDLKDLFPRIVNVV